jgi:lysine 2,3-aminomutase
MMHKTDNMPNDLLNETSDKVSNKVLYHYAENEEDIEVLKSVMEKYPVKYTSYLLRLFETSEAVRKQFLPSCSENKTSGTPTPFEEGKDASATYGLERLYRDRVLITPNFDCPAYCRFCYKKSRVMRNKNAMTYEEIDTVIKEVGAMHEVRGALVTGGEPFLDVDKLFYLLDKLATLDNISVIRIGTRTLLTMPQIFNEELCTRLAAFNKISPSNPYKSRHLAINVHFNHPDELAPEVLEACNRLTSKGILLRNQAVLLKGINDDRNTMQHLFNLLIRNNITPYYMNHCMPVEGSDHLRTSLQKGVDIYKYLCTESSTAIPHYVYAPSAGKVHVGPDSKFEYIFKDDVRYIKVKTLYKASEFKEITKKHLPPLHNETKDGYIEGLYIDGNDL